MDASKKMDENEDQAQEVEQRFTNRLIAKNLVLRQGSVNSVETNELTMRQAAAVKVSADQVQTSASAIGFLQTQGADIANTSVAVANVSGNLSMDQSGADLLLSKGEVAMDQSGAVVMVTRSVMMKNSSTAFLFAQHVEGDVTTLFDSKDALIFGAAAGLVGGMVMLFGRIFGRRR